MTALSYVWKAGDRGHALDLVYVEGTNGHPYSFGDGTDSRPMELQGFFFGTIPITQALWTHVVGFDNNPAVHRGEDLPLENVSWDEITRLDGFLDRINQSPVHAGNPSSAGGSGERHFDCRLRLSGSMQRVAEPTGLKDIVLAVATTLTRSHGMTVSMAITRSPWRRRLRTSLASTTCPATCGSGVRMCSHETYRVFPETAPHLLVMEPNASCAAAAFTIGRCTARCPNGTRLRANITMRASAFVSCSRSATFGGAHNRE